MPTNAQTHDHATDPFAVDIVLLLFLFQRSHRKSSSSVTPCCHGTSGVSDVVSAPSKPCDRIPSPKALKRMRTLKMKSSKTTLDSPNQTQRVPALSCSSFCGCEDRRQTFSQERLLHHVLREGIGVQGHGSFVGEASQRATRALQSAALREGVLLGENATRRIRSQTPWPREIGGRDEAHRANSPGTRGTCTRSVRGTITRTAPAGVVSGLTIICATQWSLPQAQVNERGPWPCTLTACPF